MEVRDPAQHFCRVEQFRSRIDQVFTDYRTRRGLLEERLNGAWPQESRM
ncbi:MAG: hypothetical protein AB1847_05085 [bacterium]